VVSLSVGAIGFAFLAAVFWGLAPVIAKRGLERGGTTMQAAMVVILTTAALAWTALLGTTGADAFAGLTLGDAGIFLVGGIVGTTLGRLSNYAGVRRVGASVTTGVMNTRPFFAVLLAVGFLHETVTAANAAGVLVLVTGVVALSLSRGGDLGGWRTADLAFPIAAALAYGSGNVIRRYGFLETTASTLEAVSLNELAALLTLGTYLLVFRRDQIVGANPAAVRYFLVSGTFSGFGLLSFFQALSLGQVSIVDPIMAMAPLFATLFTFVLLREVEVVTRGVVVGATLIVIGGGLVSL